MEINVYVMLAIFANNDPSVPQILPPLTIEAEQARQVLGVLDRMLESLESSFR